MPRRMKSRKTQFTSLRITFQLIQDIILKINYRSPSCAFSSQSWVTERTHFVSSNFQNEISVRRLILWRLIVNGDHTRTIQIATPTVGGLMKFAVKKVTCLGCKTVLTPKNSVKSRQSLPDSRLVLKHTAFRWRCLQ